MNTMHPSGFGATVFVMICAYAAALAVFLAMGSFVVSFVRSLGIDIPGPIQAIAATVACSAVLYVLDRSGICDATSSP